MFKLVLKTKLLRCSGQSSVEYTLMLVLVSGLVLGLVVFSDRIEQIVSGAKTETRNRLALGGDLSPSDFALSDAVMVADDTTAPGAGEPGGPGRGGRRARGDAEGAPGMGPDDLAGARAPGEDDDDDEIRREARRARRQDMRGAEAAPPGVAGPAGVGPGQPTGTRDRAMRDGPRAGVVPQEESMEDEASIIRRRQEQEALAGDRTLAERDWSFGKFIIILIFIIVVIIFFLKAKQAKD